MVKKIVETPLFKALTNNYDKYILNLVFNHFLLKITYKTSVSGN